MHRQRILELLFEDSKDHVIGERYSITSYGSDISDYHGQRNR